MLTCTHVNLLVQDGLSLMPRRMGPFLILDRPTESTIKIKTGTHPDGSLREEVHHWHNAVPANVGPGTPDAARPKLGRPPKQRPDPPTIQERLTPNLTTATEPTQPVDFLPPSIEIQTNDSPSDEDPPNSNESMELHTSPTTRPKRASRNQNPQYIDAMAIQPNRRYVGL